ncbi:ABC transporter substrate-binding protein [Streptococcus pneumoniae]|nr:ABC transporter substrate-binding protein [Streptococcus pneumoniae]
MIRFLVLAGYFELTIYLHLSGKLNQYINMHYSYLAYISMVLSFILAIVQLYIWMKQVKTHSHLNSRLAKMTSISLLAIPLVIGLTFPTVSLDSQTVSAKGYHFPLSEGTDLAIQTSEGTTSQYLKPDTSSYFSKSAYEKEMRTAADK